MSFAIAAPELIATAAQQLAGIGAAITSAGAAAAGATTELLPAAADEVSELIAAVFGGHANGYRQNSAQAAAFHDNFVRAVDAGAASYAGAEAAAAGLLGQALDQVIVPGAGAAAAGTAFIMGGTGNPQPAPAFVAAINSAFITPFVQANPAYAGLTAFGLYTPEGGIPFLSSISYDQSLIQGQLILNNAVMALPPGTKNLIFGFSQSASIASNEMRALAALPASMRPSPDDLTFMLIGNPDNPNGGMYTRLPISIPFLGFASYGATPPDTPYPTYIYTAQYDNVANFPQYPLNIFSTLNAALGNVFVHPYYTSLTPEQVQNAVQLGTSPGYYENGGVTRYYMFPTQNLPLLQPLRAIPLLGNPLAELLQPNLRVLVDLGYNPNGYADVPTPAQLVPGFSPTEDLLNYLRPELNAMGIYPPTYPASSPNPNFDPLAIARLLATGTQQGFTNALVTVGVLPASAYSTTYPGVASVAAVSTVAA